MRRLSKEEALKYVERMTVREPGAVLSSRDLQRSMSSHLEASMLSKFLKEIIMCVVNE